MLKSSTASQEENGTIASSGSEQHDQHLGESDDNSHEAKVNGKLTTSTENNRGMLLLIPWWSIIHTSIVCHPIV